MSYLGMDERTVFLIFPGAGARVGYTGGAGLSRAGGEERP